MFAPASLLKWSIGGKKVRAAHWFYNFWKQEVELFADFASFTAADQGKINLFKVTQRVVLVRRQNHKTNVQVCWEYKSISGLSQCSRLTDLEPEQDGCCECDGGQEYLWAPVVARRHAAPVFQATEHNLDPVWSCPVLVPVFFEQCLL
jgi:hypothetical protein